MKKTKVTDEKVCVICGGDVEPWPTRPGNTPGGYGHNPEPVKRFEEGRACRTCNDLVVVPARLAGIFSRV